VRRQRRAAARPVVLLRAHAARQGAAGRRRQPPRGAAQRHQRGARRQPGVHALGLPQRRGRRAHHPDHQDGLRLRLPARPQRLRGRDHRRPRQPGDRRARRAVRRRGRAVQRLLRLLGLQGRAGLPADHPGPAGAVAAAPRLRGARRVTSQAANAPRRSRLGYWIRGGLLALFLAFVVALPFTAGAFELRLANVVGMYALVVLGLVLLTGYAGLASLGQAAFVGSGAYTAAIAASRYGVDPWLSILAGMAVSVLLAWLIGLVTLRLKGHFLALATLAWGLVITGVLRNWLSVTGGNTGFGSATGNRIPPLSFFGNEIRGDREYYFLVWG